MLGSSQLISVSWGSWNGGSGSGAAGAAAAAAHVPASSRAAAGLGCRSRRRHRHPHHSHRSSGGGSSSSPAGQQQRRGDPHRRQPGVAVLAVSTPERVTVTDRTPPPPPPEVEVKVVGFGSRGANAISKLVAHGKVNNAQLWCLDVDKAALDALDCPGVTTLLLPKGGEEPTATSCGAVAASAGGKLDPEDLRRIVGRAASDAGGRGNINAGTDGAVTFVLAPGGAAPGGAATVVQAVKALRAAGHFTVAAVTRPFAFEGNLKQEQASELVEALRQSAHMVAVMEQDVLMQAFGDAQMTVAQATDIADNALEHSVRCILQAVQAQEILKSSRGALMWHGRDLQHFKRLLSPPLQQLLTQPGTAVLGRGIASMPAQAAHQMGAAQALMHLASDAVRAAAESPFLEGALEGASGMLCAISLPPIDQQFATGAAGAITAVLQAMQTADGQRRAVHLAAQAAAGALGSMCGPGCQDFVMCAEPRPSAEASGDGSLVEVEVTLLVLRAPRGEQRAAAAGGSGGAGTAISRRTVMGQAAPQPQPQQQGRQYGVGPAVPPPPQLPQQQQRQPQRLPASSWSALSGLAGGTVPPARAPRAATPGQAPGQAAPAQQQQQGQQARAQGGAAAAPAPAPTPAQRQPSREIPNFFGGGARRQPRPPQQQQGALPSGAPGTADAAAAPPPPLRQRQPLGTQPVAARMPVQRPSSRAAAPVQPGAPAEAQGQDPGRTKEQRMTVGDYLVDSLTAQSLDLPPAAARWRQEHRNDAFKQRKLIVWEVDEIEPWEEEEQPQGLAALLPGLQREKRVNIKERMASILMQDREDAWEAEKRSMDER